MPAFMDGNSKPRKAKKTPAVFERQQEMFDTSRIFTPGNIEIIEFVMNEGGALRFGLTRDGGALNIGIYGLGEPASVFIRPNEELGEFFGQLYTAFKGSREV